MGLLYAHNGLLTGVENNNGKASQNELALMSKLTLYRKSPNRSQMLYEMVRTFKAAASYHLRRSGKTPDFHWQREYYEHIIRNAKELNTIRT